MYPLSEKTPYEEAIFTCFDYQGMHYSIINGMKVANNDENRKEAVANLSGDKRTVFQYDDPSGCDLLCIDTYIYCPDEQVRSFDEYYRNQKLSYQIKSNYNEEYTITMDGMPDDMFFSLNDADPSVVTEYPGDLNDFCKQRTSTTLASFSIVQDCGNGELQREICLMVESDGTVYLNGIKNICGIKYWQNTFCQVTDPAVSQFIAGLVVQREKDTNS